MMSGDEIPIENDPPRDPDGDALDSASPRGRLAAIVTQADGAGRDGWLTIEVPDEISRDGYLRVPRGAFEQWAVSKTDDGPLRALPWTPVSQVGEPGVHNPFLADWLIGAGFAPADIQPGDRDPVMDAFRKSVLVTRATVEQEVMRRKPRSPILSRQTSVRAQAVSSKRSRPNPLSRPACSLDVELTEDASTNRQAEMSEFLGHTFRLPSLTMTIIARVMHRHEDAPDGFLIVRSEPCTSDQEPRNFYGPLRIWSNEEVRSAAWSILDRLEPSMVDER